MEIRKSKIERTCLVVDANEAIIGNFQNEYVLKLQNGNAETNAHCPKQQRHKNHHKEF